MLTVSIIITKTDNILNFVFIRPYYRPSEYGATNKDQVTKRTGHRL